MFVCRFKFCISASSKRYPDWALVRFKNNVDPEPEKISKHRGSMYYPLFPVCHNYSTLPNMCIFAHCLGERRDYTHTREPYGEFLPGRDH